MLLVAASLLSSALVLHPAPPARAAPMRMMASPSSAYDFSARDLDTGNVVELSKYYDSVCLFVNVASR